MRPLLSSFWMRFAAALMVLSAVPPALGQEVPATISKAVVIEFASVAGALYQIQASASLDPASWSNDGFAIRGTGGTMREVRSTTADRQFFRVVDGSAANLPPDFDDNPAQVPVRYIIALQGIYPSLNSVSANTASTDSVSTSSLEPFVGEIKLWPGFRVPRGWAACEGQLLPISQYSALFSLIGTIYGGDGRSTFGLPDLRNAVPVGRP